MMHARYRSGTTFVVLPPKGRPVSAIFRKRHTDADLYSGLLEQAQRLRGRVYLADGAIRRSQLTADGRHTSTVDEQAWHVLSLDESGGVVACLRYLAENHAKGLNDLWVRNAAIASSPHGWQFRDAVEAELLRARSRGLGFGEVGGWAVAEEQRYTLTPLSIILATYGLLQLLGGCTGVATATFRNHSSTILRRIGPRPLLWDGAELPPYFDPKYGCQMEVLQFDSRCPSPKYRDWVSDFTATLSEAPVLCHPDTIFHGSERPVLRPAALPEYAAAM